MCIRDRGPYARYAQKFLGVMAPLADKDIYTITGGKIGFAEEADPAQVYTMENPDKSPVKIYEPTREGFMAAQMDGAAPVPSAFRPAAPARRALRGNVEAVSLTGSDTSFVKVQVDRRSTVEQNPESAALDAANMIYMLRKKRMELVTGDAGEQDVYKRQASASPSKKSVRSPSHNGPPAVRISIMTPAYRRNTSSADSHSPIRSTAAAEREKRYITVSSTISEWVKSRLHSRTCSEVTHAGSSTNSAESFSSRTCCRYKRRAREWLGPYSLAIPRMVGTETP